MSVRKKWLIVATIIASLASAAFWGAYLTDVNSAVASGDLSRVKMAIRFGGSVNAVDPDGLTPLYRAALSGREDIAKFLIEHGAKINASETQKGRSPLHAAIEHPDIARLLIDNGADVNARDYDGYTPLHYAAVRSETKVAKILLAHGADSNARATGGWRGPLPASAAPSALTGLDNPAVVHTAIPQGKGQTPLYVAAIYDDWQIVPILISHKADLNARDDDGNTPLHAAAYRDATELASTLVSKGADVNARNNGGQTPLHIAARKGHLVVAMQLVSKGADVNARDRHGQTPLRYASIRGGDRKAQQGKLSVIELLRRHKARM